ncbi:uncharacterized protein LOC121997884 [Zingiber officinale]|uniref:Hydroxyproline-rich glycoprotein family protein n=1 Tax=Zingiber officinale TaxID=94328 RepID=A0A8J5G7C2_ZINOF|nr:uncharacterized protein LOC121997884 [Zingiber officinale]KAG6501366.1 hypothetical protein ZIOFF_041245 [Zingiber officinale]
MAEASSILHPSKLPTSKWKTPSPKAQKATSSVIPSILYKLILFVIVIALLPMFPSQAPEFIEESIFTRLWELLHLLFVGIAVSYGIFSQRNAEPDTDKELLQKEESPHSFISQMIHASPVFDEEDDGIGSMNERNIQSWSFQCYKNEPPNLVASKHLLLPVRSIKQQNQENDEQSTSANYGIEDHLFDSENESAVLPSPIPWISRSGSKGNKVEQVAGIKGSSIIPSTPASPTLPSPRHLSPSPSFSSDTSKPKIIYKSKASPPPPPPPPPYYLKHEHGNHATARRLKEELKNSSRRECRDATNDITSPRNEQADNCGEDVAEASGGATEETSNHEAGGGEANEVDKKADEFIARFREQIRLQRIESIKRSTKQRSNKKQQVV